MTSQMLAPAPPLLGISHIALSTSDLPASRQFWTEAMGFEAVTDTPSLLFVVHRPSRTGIAVINHEGAVRDRFDELRTGLDHLALAVADSESLEDWQRRFAAQGVTYTPIYESDGLHLNLRGPDGLALELYVMDSATAAAFGLADPGEAFAAGHPG